MKSTSQTFVVNSDVTAAKSVRKRAPERRRLGPEKCATRAMYLLYRRRCSTGDPGSRPAGSLARNGGRRRKAPLRRATPQKPRRRRRRDQTEKKKNAPRPEEPWERLCDRTGRPEKKLRAPPPEALKKYDCDLHGRPDKKRIKRWSQSPPHRSYCLPRLKRNPTALESCRCMRC